MLDVHGFCKALQRIEIDHFCGVPDSLLKNFLNGLSNEKSVQNLICANEGSAVAYASGIYAASGKIAAVYLQNSGLGNCVNPLVSLTSKDVYSIPCLLIIGWRGEPNTKDEPQHVFQGKITTQLLDLLKIPYSILAPDTDETELNEIIDRANEWFILNKTPYCILVKKDSFIGDRGNHVSAVETVSGFASREEALSIILNEFENSLFVATTGKTSREVFEIRTLNGQKTDDFLMVGSMGHALSFAAGAASFRGDKQVVCLDGDGSLLMHMGASPVTALSGLTGLIHVVLNNAAHESVGGQPTCANEINFEKFASALGYRAFFQAKSPVDLKKYLPVCAEEAKSGVVMLEVIIPLGSRENLSRPTTTPRENLESFSQKFND